jgi:hypothetical protein
MTGEEPAMQYSPPPREAEFPLMRQLIKVGDEREQLIPPPSSTPELLLIMHFIKAGDEEMHKMPPPELLLITEFVIIGEDE